MISNIKELARNIQIIARFAGYRYFKYAFTKNFGLRVVSRPFNNQDSVIILAPHPDDEVIGCGGALALAARASARVGVIYITNGSHGTTSGKKDSNLIKARRREALVGLKVIGKNIRTKFLGFDDGGYRHNDNAAIQIASLIQKEPGFVHVFTPWYFDDNSDHVEVTKTLLLALNLIDKSQIKIWQYEVWAPLVANTILPIGKVASKKVAAIKNHKSQTYCRNYESATLGLNNFRAMAADTKEPCEAFFVTDVKTIKKIFKL